MAVYYKFKSARDYDSIPMDGPFISVGTLKEKIFESKHLGRGKDFDLVVTNAQTNEEYLDEAMLIPKNTSVLIRRVPGRPRLPIVAQQEPKTENTVEDTLPEKSDFAGVDSSAMTFPEESDWDEFGNDLYATPEALPVQSSNNTLPDAPLTNVVDEDSKIKALIDTPALDWQRQGLDGFGPGRGFGRATAGRMGGRGFGRMGLERKTPPPGYICHRCKVPGHFIQHCPTNGDPNYDIKRVKPPTGIPKSMLMATPDGSYALPSGAVAVLKPNEAAFEKEVEGLPSTRSVGELPPELRCPLCNEVMKDAVLTSKCCLKSFCDKCIRDYIISRSICVCGATDILADDLLPNKTLRETINRILESGTSSAENAGSTFQVQDMESARCPPPKIPSPSTSAAPKGEQKPVPHGEAPNGKAIMELAKAASTPQPTTENVRAANKVDASEATHESMSLKEATSQGSAPVADEEVQQKAPAELGKKKKKKKIRLPANDMQWNAVQDLAAGNYMMPMGGPSGFNSYWNGMQPGMDGFMGPYGGSLPFTGYGLGPLDMSFGAVMPPGPFGPQGFMFPHIPPHRDLAELGMGMNMPPVPPHIMSREEFEARKADLRKKRENERRGESREFSRDRDYGREARSGFDAPSTKPRLKPLPPSSSGDHHHHRHRFDRSSQEHSVRDLEPSSHPSKRKSDHHHHHHYSSSEHDRGFDRGRSHEHDCERARSRDHDHGRERSRDREYNLDHHDYDRERELHHHHHHRSEPSSRPAPEPKPTSISSTSAADKKHKASVFSRISFPEEELASKKRKISSSSTDGNGGSASGSSAHHHSLKFEYQEAKISASLAASDEDYESSDDDRHFKRKPSRYEPSPPPLATEWEDEEPPRHSKGSREREGYSKHR